MKRFLLFLLWVSSGSVMASHIVGGEFELLHISGSTYRINLIIYFDQINGSVGAKDPSATVSIFQKSNDQLITNVLLTLSQELNVDYTQPECSNGEIVTSKLIYTGTITLSPGTYNAPDGYYLVWQRCCRNYSITNIYSPEPVAGGLYAGQTFYLEFPPVVKDDEPFINSSPHLFPPLNDYACPGRPYYVDFAGIDDDGDSLVYTMVTPLNTHTIDALPPIESGPYPNVTWKPGFGLDSIIRGMPDLAISKEGLLKATPQVQGLFVFAVKVDEFRDGIKIGESRRDFQMLVVDGCAHAEPPMIAGKKPVDADFIYDEVMTVTYTNTVADEDRCIQVQISDPDASNPLDQFMEKVRIRAVGLNFNDKNLTEILPEDVSETLVNGSTAIFTICFPACPLGNGGPYEVGIIAMDDACSLPLTDTLKITVFVEPPPNTSPYFTSAHQTTQPLDEGNADSWLFQAKDDDGDSLHVTYVTNGFLLDDAGMAFGISNQADGLVEGQLSWEAFCDIYDFTSRKEFQVRIIVEDVDKCETTTPDVAVYDLRVILPGNADPIIDTDLTVNPLERVVNGVERKIFESLTFNVTGKDTIDHDFLVLDLANKQVWEDYGVTFERKEGNSKLVSAFNWQLDCGTIDFGLQNIFDFQFIVIDNANKCKLYKADTVNVNVTILPPDNLSPSLVVNNLNTSLQLLNNELEVTLGEQIVLGLQGHDGDLVPKKDELNLGLIKATGSVAPAGYVFEPVTGEGSVSTTFTWNPDCSIFENDIFENAYEFTFRLSDDRCHEASADTVVVKIKIRDVDGSDDTFTPVNFFSPNGDGYNDYYSMEILDKETGELRNILPPDNCTSQFQAIRIYNRWGNQVFVSTDRNFRWLAENEAAGVYFYLIQYSNKEYKGSLSIRY
jgi:hypothetical protein